MADAESTVNSLVPFLQAHCRQFSAVDPERAATFIRPEHFSPEPRAGGPGQDQGLVNLLESLEGAHETFPTTSLPALASDRHALIESRRGVEVELWDLKQFVKDPKVDAVMRSNLGPIDIRRIDRLKSALRSSRVLRLLSRRVYRSY